MRGFYNWLEEWLGEFYRIVVGTLSFLATALLVFTALAIFSYVMVSLQSCAANGPH